MSERPVYFDAGWDASNDELLDDFLRLTPGGDGRWEDLVATRDPSEAEFHVALNAPSRSDRVGRLLLYCMEPPCIPRCDDWEEYDAWKTHPLSDHYRPQKWMVGKSYDELVGMDPPSPSKPLSWITTDKGRNLSGIESRIRRGLMVAGVQKHRPKAVSRFNFPTDGHLLRMDFYERLLDFDPDLLDLYGYGDFSGPHYQGTVEDKWDGLVDYRYSLAVENYEGPNYWSEKVTDALLAWCMPIYWGCTNLERYLPEDSFVRLDIESSDAPRRVREVVESDRYERNLDAIAEARRRILNEYQIWPTVKRSVDETDGD